MDGARQMTVRMGRATQSRGSTSLRQLYETRFALERASVWRPEQTGAVHDPLAIDELALEWESLIDAGPDEAVIRFPAADEDFHLGLSAAAGDPGLTLALVDLNARIRAVRRAGRFGIDRVRSAAEEHLEVLAEIRRGAIDRAARRLDRHLARSMATAERDAAVDLARQIVGRVSLV